MTSLAYNLSNRIRMIDYLRQTYPEFKWTYNQSIHRWTSPDTDYAVGSYSQLTPKYDGDDESSMVIFIDTDGHQIFLPHKPVKKTKNG